jgi:hypothetical protein
MHALKKLAALEPHCLCSRIYLESGFHNKSPLRSWWTASSRPRSLSTPRVAAATACRLPRFGSSNIPPQQLVKVAFFRTELFSPRFAFSQQSSNGFLRAGFLALL